MMQFDGGISQPVIRTDQNVSQLLSMFRTTSSFLQTVQDEEANLEVKKLTMLNRFTNVYNVPKTENLPKTFFFFGTLHSQQTEFS